MPPLSSQPLRILLAFAANPAYCFCMKRTLSIGERLLEARLKLDLSQAAFAVQIGIAPRSLASFEGGKSLPKQAQVLYRLAAALGIEFPEIKRLAESEAKAS